MKEIGNTKICPHCGKHVKFGIRQGRFLLVFGLLAVIAILTGESSPIAAGIAGGFAAMFSMGLKAT